MNLQKKGCIIKNPQTVTIISYTALVFSLCMLFAGVSTSDDNSFGIVYFGIISLFSFLFFLSQQKKRGLISQGSDYLKCHCEDCNFRWEIS